MAEVTLDTFDELPIRGPSLDLVHVSERDDAETIQKIKQHGVPQLPYPIWTMDDYAVTVLNQEIQEMVASEEFERVENIVVENPDKEAHYLVRFETVLAALLRTMNQKSEKDKNKIELLKKEYKNHTLNAAQTQRDLGWNSLKFAGLAFAASFLQFASTFQSDRDIANIFAREVCPKLGDLWGSDLQARLTTFNNGAQLQMNEYNLLSNAQQSEGGDKQTFTQAFEKALRTQSAATSG